MGRQVREIDYHIQRLVQIENIARFERDGMSHETGANESAVIENGACCCSGCELDYIYGV